MNIKISIVFLALFALPFFVEAGPVLRSGETISVMQDQVLEGDFYGLGGKVLMSGQANHDVYVAGGSVTVNAPVAEDLTVAAGSVQIHSTIGDDVRVLGGEVTIGGTVEGDLVVAGGVLTLLSTAVVEGDLLFFGGEIDMGGAVSGSMIGVSEAVRINGSVGGDVSVTAARNLSLGSRAHIEGNLVYKSSADAQRAQEAVVVGTIQKNAFDQNSKDEGYASLLLPVVALLFAGLTAYMLFKRHLQALADLTWTHYGTNGLIGLAVFVAVPFVSVLLMVTVLGFLVGLSLLFLYIFFLIASFIISGIILGTVALRATTKKSEVTALSAIVGILLFAVLPLVPVIGPLILFGLVVVVLGGMATTFYKLLR